MISPHSGRETNNTQKDQQMNSMEDLAQAAASMGGNWVNLRHKEDGPIEGRILDFTKRDKTFEGAPVLNRKTGQPRVESFPPTF